MQTICCHTSKTLTRARTYRHTTTLLANLINPLFPGTLCVHPASSARSCIHAAKRYWVLSFLFSHENARKSVGSGERLPFYWEKNALIRKVWHWPLFLLVQEFLFQFQVLHVCWMLSSCCATSVSTLTSRNGSFLSSRPSGLKEFWLTLVSVCWCAVFASSCR